MGALWTAPPKPFQDPEGFGKTTDEALAALSSNLLYHRNPPLCKFLFQGHTYWGYVCLHGQPLYYVRIYDNEVDIICVKLVKWER
jgi:hypothetical protein